MTNKHLATYLNDHLAASLSAIKLLQQLEAAPDDTALGRFAAELRLEVLADRAELETLMHRLQIGRSSLREAVAWLAEKATELKLKLDDRAGGALQVFEALEAIELGLEGKRSLWRALAAAAERVPDLQGPDYNRLSQRAQDQHQRVEAVRLQSAKTALAFSA